MIHSIFLVGMLLLLVPCSGMAQQQLANERTRAAMEGLSFASLWEHAAILAHDSLGGRGTGSKGERGAAAYIADRLRAYGVKPGGEASGYFQPVPLHGSLPLSESRLQVYHGADRFDLELQQDYVLYKTGAQTFLPQPLRMVFVGYGIVAPEFDYNDYQNLDVNGAIVVFLDGEPPSDAADYFDAMRATLHSVPEMKQRVALARGARGSVLLQGPRGYSGYSWPDWVRMFSFEDVTLPITIPSHLSLMLNPDKVELLFRGSEWSFADVIDFDSSGRMRSFPLQARLSFAGSFRERDFLAHNVAGILEGSDPLLRDSWVLCTAHFDHLGYGPSINGDSIYNGLVDNALGTAAALELARVLASPSARPQRSILFLFVTGEEKGLLGSQFYCANPLVPLYKTTACLNIDGLSIIDEVNDIVGIGSEYSTLSTLLDRLAAELGLEHSPIPPLFDHLEAFSSSDQIAFAQAGIPSMLVMEGTSYRNQSPEEGFERFIQWGRERYHTPFDDLVQPIDQPAVTQHTRILLATLSALANTWEPPQWVRGINYINARLQSLAEGR